MSLSLKQIKSLPKISLHDHLDGGVRIKTLIELSAKIGHTLPSTDPKELAAWFHQSADSHDLVTYLKTFDHTIAIMQTVEGLTRVAREFVQDLAEDGVIWGEIRWAPEQHLHQGLTLDQVVEAVQEGIDLGVADAAKKDFHMDAGQILCAMRHQDNALDIAKLAVRHRNIGVVGFDIAGPEIGFLPSRHRAAFEYLAEHMFPTTVHAGEEGGLSSIRSAIVDGRTLRLGHGVHVVEDIQVTDAGDHNSVVLGEVASWVLDRGIAIECCPRSNMQTAAMDGIGDSIEDHPFDLFYQLGFRATISPDNRLMSDTSVSRELELMVETFEYDLRDLELIQLNAVDAAFLPLDVREELSDRVIAEFAIAAERLGLNEN
ncbi:MAG: adenosine deaminase [Microbacteriaceae bacterium]